MVAPSAACLRAAQLVQAIFHFASRAADITTRRVWAKDLCEGYVRSVADPRTTVDDRLP